MKTRLTEEEIRKKIEEYDLLLHPYIIVVSPNTYNILKAQLPSFDKQYFQRSAFVEDDKCILIDRKAIKLV